MQGVSESFDFFFEAEFFLLEFGNHQIVRVRTKHLVVDQFVEFVVLVREFLEMRLKAHVGSLHCIERTNYTTESEACQRGRFAKCEQNINALACLCPRLAP